MNFSIYLQVKINILIMQTILEIFYFHIPVLACPLTFFGWFLLLKMNIDAIVISRGYFSPHCNNLLQALANFNQQFYSGLWNSMYESMVINVRKFSHCDFLVFHVAWFHFLSNKLKSWKDRYFILIWILIDIFFLLLFTQ